MKTPLETRGSRANDGRSARLGKKQPDGTHAHRIAHVPRIRPACAIVARDRSPAGRSWLFAPGGGPAALTSSLHAVTAAAAALRAGELDLAIVGGAELGLDPVWLTLQA